MRIGDNFTLQMPGEQPSLHLNQPSHGDAIAKKRMRGFLLHTALKRGDERLATTGL